MLWSAEPIIRGNVMSDPAKKRKRTPRPKPIASNVLTIWPIERLRGKAETTDDGCWLWPWVGSSGYGVLQVKKESFYVHRIAWAGTHGDTPLPIDHLCGHKPCFNPEHLDPVTQRENLLRSPRTLAGRNARKETCLRGHPLIPARLSMVRGQGARRYCPVCERMRERRRAQTS